MPVSRHVEQHIKGEIILKIRDGSMKVTDAADKYGISSKTIYVRLREGVVDGNRNLILELNKLLKENELPKRLAILEEVDPGMAQTFCCRSGHCPNQLLRPAE